MKVPAALQEMVDTVEEHMTTGCDTHTAEDHRAMSEEVMQDVMKALNECSDVTPELNSDILTGIHIAMTVFGNMSGMGMEALLLTTLAGGQMARVAWAVHAIAKHGENAAFEDILKNTGLDDGRSADEIIANLEAEEKKNDPGYL